MNTWKEILPCFFPHLIPCLTCWNSRLSLSSWKPAVYTSEGIGQESSTLHLTLQFHFLHLIPSFVANHLLWPLFPLCPHSLGTKILLFYSLSPLPLPSLSPANDGYNLSLETHKPHQPGNQIFIADLAFSLPKTLSALHTSSLILVCQFPIPINKFY